MDELNLSSCCSGKGLSPIGLTQRAYPPGAISGQSNKKSLSKSKEKVTSLHHDSHLPDNKKRGLFAGHEPYGINFDQTGKFCDNLMDLEFYLDGSAQLYDQKPSYNQNLCQNLVHMNRFDYEPC